jgi:sarcosine oxidase, subunit delta
MVTRTDNVTMLLIVCPYCGPRPELEFRYGGEAHVARPAATAGLDDNDVASALFLRTNARGVHAERWRHIHGCGRFFNCLRDTVSDHILATYKSDEPRPEVSHTKGERA